MADSSVLVSMSNGDSHDIALSPKELEGALRTNSGLVRLSLRGGDSIWLNPAHIVSARERRR